MTKIPDGDDKLLPERAFLANEVFPDASQAFAFRRPDLTSCIDECDVVLDTNVLLLPYRAGPNSLAEIAKVLRPLRDQGRLFVPGQVAREFARNQPKKLGELYFALHQQSSQASVPSLNRYPLLEAIPEYDDLKEASEKLKQAKNGYSKATSALLEVIKGWAGNDPVAEAFRELFTPETVRDPGLDQETVLKEMERRYTLEIPPGYKDSGKTDGGVGDYLIWLTIKGIGKDRKRPLAFVTGEEKTDWYHRTSGTALLPRFELLDEFRRASDGRPLFIVQLSELLTLLKAEGETVAEVKKEEERERAQVEEQLTCPECGEEVFWRIRRAAGSSALPSCASCGARFHAHRTPNGLITRTKGEPVARRQGYEEVAIDCPKPECGTKVPCRIGLNLGDSALLKCESCGGRFHAHRGRDGSVFCRLPDSRSGSEADEEHDT